ncbi:TOMM precursor leader peptide-binding protein [Halodesulfovibrio sp.]|jgi:thiazole/oxazole-forming peptide maturase SagC family component|uniref:TOMM precursor leader peptide-binding protein n=1 Tax=Halodesulfovibrio sp. TaxID=1912772 RepID=UPI0025FB1EF8|nr:TOMM precursor leader peptide-binding protein [Halodesulfovibrio sp.]MCT4626399.1 TOMM precursor leader peptide-binding protein [Halodesulfovibrio sp.]
MQTKISKLPQLPVVNTSYHIIEMDGDRVQFRNGQDLFVIKGPNLLNLINDLMPLLTGENTLPEIISQLADRYPEKSIISILTRLTQRRVVRERIEATPETSKIHPAQQAYFSQFSPNANPNLAALASAHVAVIGLGPIGTSVAHTLAQSGIGRISVSDSNPVQLEDTLAAEAPSATIGSSCEENFVMSIRENFPEVQWDIMDLSLRHIEREDHPDYIVVCHENYRPDMLADINTFCLSSGVPYTWCSLDALCGTVGPTVLPHETACFECYTTRLNANADYPDELQAYEQQLRTNGNPTLFGYLPSHTQLIAGLVSLEVVKDISGLTPPVTYNAQLELNLLTMEFALHPVLKLPRCSACSRLQHSGAPVRPFAEQAV